MILTTKVIVIITIIIITMIIKYRGRYRTPTTTNTVLAPCDINNGRRPLSNIKKSSISHAVTALYTLLKRLIHLLT